jgi:hypothetical protein
MSLKECLVIAAPSIPCLHIRTGLARLDEPLTFELAIVSGQHVSKAVDRALPLIQR